MSLDVSQHSIPTSTSLHRNSFPAVTPTETLPFGIRHSFIFPCTI
jgi:hypothetical protein